MPDTIEVKFTSGNIVRFGNEQGGGLSPAGARDAVVDQTAKTFDKALGALGDVVARLEAAIGGLKRRPDGVEVEFSASLKGDCDLWVVAGEAEAEFKVTLKWDRKEA